MIATVITGSTIGIEGYIIQVEVDIASSLPGVVIGVVLVLAGLFLVIRNTGFFPDFIDDVDRKSVV